MFRTMAGEPTFSADALEMVVRQDALDGRLKEID
jgi:hypothetical protein